MSLKEIQKKYADLIWKGENSFSDPRMAVYQNLVFENIRSALEIAFPLFFEEFDGVSYCRRFIEECGPQSPYYRAIADDFCSYIQKSADIDPVIKEIILHEYTTYRVLFLKNNHHAALPDLNLPLEKLFLEVNSTLSLLKCSYPLTSYKLDENSLRDGKPLFLAVFQTRQFDIKEIVLLELEASRLEPLIVHQKMSVADFVSDWPEEDIVPLLKKITELEMAYWTQA